MPRKRKSQTQGRRKNKRRRVGSSTGSSSSMGGTLSGVINNSMLRSTAVMPKNCQLFPDILYTQGRTVVDAFPSNTSAQYLSFKANGVMYQFGPQSNFSGAFQGNVPSGAANLLSSGNGPYDTVWTLDTELEVNALCTTGPCLIVLLPSIYTSTPISSLSATNAAEQRGAASYMINTALLPQRLTLKYHPAEIFGIDKKVYENTLSFGQFVGLDPANICYVHVIMYPLNGANGSCSLNIVWKQRFKVAAVATTSVAVPS